MLAGSIDQLAQNAVEHGALSSTEATPLMISPSVGISSLADTRK
jgi:hypothetical protein